MKTIVDASVIMSSTTTKKKKKYPVPQINPQVGGKKTIIFFPFKNERMSNALLANVPNI